MPVEVRTSPKMTKLEETHVAQNKEDQTKNNHRDHTSPIFEARQQIEIVKTGRPLRCLAQYDNRASILCDRLRSRACLSYILAYAFHLEESEILLRRLCKKGALFVTNDEGLLQSVSKSRKQNAKKINPYLQAGLSNANRQALLSS